MKNIWKFCNKLTQLYNFAPNHKIGSFYFMKVQKAGELFHGEERYNCAQAVMKTFQEDFNIKDEEVLRAKVMGGGRADKGLCGALYGALYLLGEEEGKDILIRAFEANAGSVYCREIKALKKLKCRDCVKLAASELDKMLCAI